MQKRGQNVYMHMGGSVFLLDAYTSDSKFAGPGS